MKTLIALTTRTLGTALIAGLLTAAAADSSTPAAPVKAKASAYRIQPTDQLSITVGGEPELSVVGKKVDASGNIKLLYVPEVHVAGLTTGEAIAAIENAYRDARILRNPQVFVNIEVYAPREVTVNGFVKFPGKVQILPETVMTLKDAVSKCGGLSDTANGRNVTVTRILPDGTTKIIEKLDVESALLGKKSATIDDANFVLEPGDTVYVKEKII